MARRQHLTVILITALVAACTVFYLFSGADYVREVASAPAAPAAKAQSKYEFDGKAISAAEIEEVAEGITSGGSIAGKMENATAKAELGRATWKFLHTTMARFPETATEEDSLALTTFVHLFARLYPCGDCASHFRMLLEEYPPQTSGRMAAAGWACFVHNEVNARLGKEMFDCNKIGDFYDCGCAEEEGEGEGKDGEKGEAEEAGEEKEGDDGTEVE